MFLLTQLENYFKRRSNYSCNAKYIRAILKSATAISPSKHATAEHIRTATSLFETIGLVSVVEEEDMHAVTALSGSGPAYIYYVVEAMEEVATKIGLKEDVAKITYSSNDDWCAEMLKVSDKHPSILRKEITSPGGTTEAGIEVLQEHKFHQALVSCITQATKRSHNLGKTLEQLTKRKGAQVYLSSFFYNYTSYCSSQKSSCRRRPVARYRSPPSAVSRSATGIVCPILNIASITSSHGIVLRYTS